MNLLSEGLSFCEDRMVDMGLKEISARLASLVLHLCESEGLVTVEGYKIPTRYTHQQLGAMIGSKRVATTRALGKLQKIGAVELKQRYICEGCEDPGAPLRKISLGLLLAVWAGSPESGLSS